MAADISVWPLVIDHITVKKGKYTRDNREIETETYLFYLNVANVFSFNRPSVMACFTGTNDGLIALYKDIPTEEINGETIITGKAIRETKEPGKDEIGPYKDPNGIEFPSYGEYLVTMGTKNAFDPKPGTVGGVFAELPLSDGVQRFFRKDENGHPLKTSKGQPIIQTHIEVAGLVYYRPDGKWKSMYGTPEETLAKELHQQRDRLWHLIEDEDDDEDDEDDNDGNDTESGTGQN